jgi:hypothetical protein
MYNFMEIEAHVAGLTSFAVHRVSGGWEIIAPSDDPTTPAYWRVGIIRQSQFGICGSTLAEFYGPIFNWAVNPLLTGDLI